MARDGGLQLPQCVVIEQYYVVTPIARRMTALAIDAVSMVYTNISIIILQCTDDNTMFRAMMMMIDDTRFDHQITLTRQSPNSLLVEWVDKRASLAYPSDLNFDPKAAI